MTVVVWFLQSKYGIVQKMSMFIFLISIFFIRNKFITLDLKRIDCLYNTSSFLQSKGAEFLMVLFSLMLWNSTLIALTSILDIRKSNFDLSYVIFLPFMVNNVMKNHLIWLKDYVTGVKIRRISRIFTPHQMVIKKESCALRRKSNWLSDAIRHFQWVQMFLSTWCSCFVHF